MKPRSAPSARARAVARSVADTCGATQGDTENPAPRGVFLWRAVRIAPRPSEAHRRGRPMMLEKRISGAAALASAVLTVAACATGGSSRQTTAEALTAILAADHRSAENRGQSLGGGLARAAAG